MVEKVKLECVSAPGRVLADRVLFSGKFGMAGAEKVRRLSS
jgi:hypothetical protein